MTCPAFLEKPQLSTPNPPVRSAIFHPFPPGCPIGAGDEVDDEDDEDVEDVVL
jgi:hypothetical protein